MNKKKGALDHYETLFIVHPVHGTRNQEIVNRFTGVLTGQGAEVTHVEEWGIRDLAYPISKQQKGLYNLLQYRGSRGTVLELERVMGLTDEVIRYLTVALDEDVRPITKETKVEEAPPESN